MNTFSDVPISPMLLMQTLSCLRRMASIRDGVFKVQNIFNQGGLIERFLNEKMKSDVPKDNLHFSLPACFGEAVSHCAFIYTLLRKNEIFA